MFSLLIQPAIRGFPNRNPTFPGSVATAASWICRYFPAFYMSSRWNFWAQFLSWYVKVFHYHLPKLLQLLNMWPWQVSCPFLFCLRLAGSSIFLISQDITVILIPSIELLKNCNFKLERSIRFLWFSSSYLYYTSYKKFCYANVVSKAKVICKLSELSLINDSYLSKYFVRKFYVFLLN